MYNTFESHFDPFRLSKIGMAHPVSGRSSSHRLFGEKTIKKKEIRIEIK